VSAYNATGTRLWSVNLAGNGIEALAALPNGNIVVETFSTGQQNTGQITVFDSAGHFIAQSGLAGALLGSATITTLQNGGFVAAWNDGQIESQIYDSSGHAVGAKIQVSPIGEDVGGTNNRPSNLAVAGLKNGNYVVVWGVDIPTTGALPNNYLRGQVYDAQGHMVGDNFIFATGVNLENNFPEIAALANGSFVVTWIQQPTAPGAGVFGPQEEIFSLPGTLFPNHAPTITATTVTTTADQPVLLSSLFQASDADGDALTYTIYDGTPGANTGHFVVAGSVIGAGGAVNLTAAQLAQTTFVAGATGVTDDIRVIAYDGHDYSGGGIYTQLHVNVSVVTQPPPNDFNLDAKSDMLLRNNTGVVVNWEMNNAVLLHSNSFGTVPFNWHIFGVNDFSGDGRADILWQNDAGAVQTWDINGGTLTGTHSLGVVPANWHIIGTGDFNGDHNADILWRKCEQHGDDMESCE
jgi:hypothetical protein